MGKNDQSNSASPRKPQKFSKPGWKNALKMVFSSIGNHNLNIVAAGVGFYLLLGMIPALAGLISIYGLVSDPADVQEHFAQIEGAIPDEASQLLHEQMSRISEEQSAAGWGAAIGIILALWAGSRASMAMMEGLNITYETKESRGLVKKFATRFGLTVGAVLMGLVAIGIIVVVPPLLNAMPLGDGLTTTLSLIRWPLLLILGVTALALLYRFAPSRPQPKFRWLSWGSGVAAVLWVIASAGFSFYVARFGDFNETYGSLGAVVILLMWLYISAFVILLGAEVDSAFETQTEKEVLPREGGKNSNADDSQAHQKHGRRSGDDDRRQDKAA